MTGASKQATFDRAGAIRAADAAGSWRLEPSSEVSFAVKNFWGLGTVRGAFDSVTGTATVTEDGTVTGTLVIDAASVNTKQAKRDDHLRSEDFFDVEQHPAMRVEVDEVELTSSTQGTARGQATIAGQTRPIEFPVTLAAEPDGTQVVSGEVTIDRSAYGISWRPMRMAGLDVAVSFRLPFRRRGDE